MSDQIEQKNENISSEERLQWLRERGVFVETSEDRKAKKSNASSSGEYELISYVYVPHDTSKPMKEMAFRVYKEKASVGDLLPDHLKPMFGSLNTNSKDIDLTLFHQQASHHLTSSENAPPTISDATMRKLAEEGQVETFCLVKPVSSNKYTSVNIYLDEVGMLKRLPLNSRATEFAAKAGYNPPPTFYGDVFIGRVSNKPKIMNKNFHLGTDTSPDADWIKNAMMENLEHQTAMNQISGRSDTYQPSVAGEDGIAKDENGYKWTQTDEELEINVPIPSDTVTKQIKVNFLPTHVQVWVQKELILRIDLFSRIDPDGCTWTLDKGAKTGDKSNLVITCEKVEAISWPRITF